VRARTAYEVDERTAATAPEPCEPVEPTTAMVRVDMAVLSCGNEVSEEEREEKRKLTHQSRSSPCLVPHAWHSRTVTAKGATAETAPKNGRERASLCSARRTARASETRLAVEMLGGTLVHASGRRQREYERERM